MRRRVVILSVLLFTSFFPSATTENPFENFTLTIEYRAGDPIQQGFAYYLAKVLPLIAIEVKVVEKHYGQYVNDLIVNRNKPYDLAFSIFSDAETLLPDFFEMYHSQGFIGKNVFQLSNPEWKDWIQRDVDITQDEVDQLIINISRSFDWDGIRKELTERFQRLFMEKLLYSLPLLQQIGLMEVRNSLVPFYPEEGWERSIFLGAQWIEQPEERKNDNKTIAIPLRNMPQSFDPLWHSTPITDLIYPRLFLFSKELGSPHPYLVRQYNISTWKEAQIDGNTTDISNGKLDLWLNGDWQWISPNGTSLSPVTGQDVKFTFDLILNRSLIETQTAKAIRFQIHHVEFNSTDNRISVFLRDPKVENLRIMNIPILPSFLLGGDLHFDNGTVIRALENSNAGSFEDFDPFQTLEWKEFSSNPVQSGPFIICSSNSTQGGSDLIELVANPYFTFPNEWDINDFFLGNNQTEEAYFFVWSDDPSTTQKEKPNRFKIEKFFPKRNDVVRLLMEPITYANGSTLDDPAITYGIVFSNFMNKGVFIFKGGTDRLINLMKTEMQKNGGHPGSQNKGISCQQ